MTYFEPSCHPCHALEPLKARYVGKERHEVDMALFVSPSKRVQKKSLLHAGVSGGLVRARFCHCSGTNGPRQKGQRFDGKTLR